MSHSQELQQEIKVLKRLIKAQNQMILHYRIGNSILPEWVFKAIDSAKTFYKVNSISEINK